MTSESNRFLKDLRDGVEALKAHRRGEMSLHITTLTDTSKEPKSVSIGQNATEPMTPAEIIRIAP
jgi:hypothetical protein